MKLTDLFCEKIQNATESKQEQYIFKTSCFEAPHPPPLFSFIILIQDENRS